MRLVVVVKGLRGGGGGGGGSFLPIPLFQVHMSPCSSCPRRSVIKPKKQGSRASRYINFPCPSWTIYILSLIRSD